MSRVLSNLAEDRPKIEEQIKLESQQSGKSVKLTDLNLTSARRLLAAPKSPEGSRQGQGSPKSEPSTEKYKHIENELIACLKDLRERAESYAANTIEALRETVDDIKSVIEQAQAKRGP